MVLRSLRHEGTQRLFRSDINEDFMISVGTQECHATNETEELAGRVRSIKMEEKAANLRK